MNATTTHRDLAAILADLADFTVASSGAKAAGLYHELEDAVRAQLAPLPEGEAERMAAEAERDARTMAPPTPGVTSHNGYVVRAVVYNHAHADGYLEAWWIAGEDSEGRWVTWNAYAGDPAGSQAGRLSYDAGNYFGSPDARANRRAALADLAVRAGTTPGVAQHIALEIAGHPYAAPEDKRMAARLRRYFTR
jgi:hypothetical protein